MNLTRGALAAMIDHTLLAPEATDDHVRALCDEAIALEVCAVCVSPTMARLAVERLDGHPVRVAAVIGFPSGAHRSGVKAEEARRGADEGIDEADMVIDLGLAMSGDWAGVSADIACVRHVLSDGQLLKVIVESALLSDEQLVSACHAAQDAGADFVKTSTGFHPAGGASVKAVAIMATAVGSHLGVKASGGIRDVRTAFAMVQAGATRLGMSSTAAVLAAVPPTLRSIA